MWHHPLAPITTIINTQIRLIMPLKPSEAKQLSAIQTEMERMLVDVRLRERNAPDRGDICTSLAECIHSIDIALQVSDDTIMAAEAEQARQDEEQN